MRTISSVMTLSVPGAAWLSAVAEVELLGDQLPMPAQQRVGRDDRAQFEEKLAWDAEPLDREVIHAWTS